MKFKFSWQTTVYGQIEIEAENGNHAEKLFHEMSFNKRIENSPMQPDEKSTQINYVDFDWCDSLTYEEWNEKWNLSDRKWEEWIRIFNISN